MSVNCINLYGSHIFNEEIFIRVENVNEIFLNVECNIFIRNLYYFQSFLN